MIVWAPLASGFLTDGFSLDELHEGGFRHTHRFARLELDPIHDALCGDRGSAARGALAFVLSHPAATGAIVGVRDQREPNEAAEAADLRLTAAEAGAIDRLTRELPAA